MPGIARCLIYDVAPSCRIARRNRPRGKATRALIRSLSNHDRILRVSIHLVLAFCKCTPGSRFSSFRVYLGGPEREIAG
jgi:hypothetical protein